MNCSPESRRRIPHCHWNPLDYQIPLSTWKRVKAVPSIERAHSKSAPKTWWNEILGISQFRQINPRTYLVDQDNPSYENAPWGHWGTWIVKRSSSVSEKEHFAVNCQHTLDSQYFQECLETRSLSFTYMFLLYVLSLTLTLVFVFVSAF